MTTEFSKMQQLKRRFFAMRNGVIADCMRKAGAPYRIVFGLTLPQLTEIARDFAGDAEMARILWHNTSTRESVLIAPMIMPADEMTVDEAREWIRTAASAEAIDVLCLKLLRRLDFAAAVAQELADSEEPLGRYTSLRLWLNLLPANQEIAARIAAKELAKNERATKGVARQLIDEIEFLRES